VNPPVRDLAQYIANRSRIVVKAAIRAENEQGELLLIQHAEQGPWGIPVGKMRPGETVEDAAARELWEETGWTADGMMLQGLYSGPEFRQLHSSGDEDYFVIAVFRAFIVQDDHVRSRLDSAVGMNFFASNALPPLNEISRRLLELSDD